MIENTSMGNSPNQNDYFMPHDARRVLVYLMRKGTILSTQNSNMFDLLCHHENAIRRHLSEVYLQLVLDQKNGVGFIASYGYENKLLNENKSSNPQNYPLNDSNHDSNLISETLNPYAQEDDVGPEETSSLITKRVLTLFDTLILLVLRKHYQDRESAGEQKITIGIEQLESYLLPFLPITDHASKDRKKLLARVKEMIKRKILSTITGSDDRYEITPIIRYVVSASFLESMLLEYENLATAQNDFKNISIENNNE